MNYTTFTAIILTIHQLSAFFSLIFAFLFSALAYWFFLKRQKNRALALLITFLAFLVLAALGAEKVFHKNPFGIEVVTAG